MNILSRRTEEWYVHFYLVCRYTDLGDHKTQRKEEKEGLNVHDLCYSETLHRANMDISWRAFDMRRIPHKLKTQFVSDSPEFTRW